MRASAAARASSTASSTASSKPAFRTQPVVASNATITLRFAEKRDLILDGAARLFNRRGIKAGTLAEVAASVGLASNSLTYYFRKKEDLVSACLLRSIEVIDEVVTVAALADTPALRVAALVRGYLAVMAAVADCTRSELIFFNDMRALPQPQAAPVFAAYVQMWRGVRELLQPGPATVSRRTVAPSPRDSGEARRALNARAHLLLAEVLWSRAWLTRFETSDYPRVARVMTDLLLNGLAAPGQGWGSAATPGASDVPALEDIPDPQADLYLRTATRLINDHGVGGASVDRIAAALALTKGSFYHHHPTKEGLVDACFERSFALIRRVQLRAITAPGTGWQRLLHATLPLVALHDPSPVAAAAERLDATLAGTGPLLRLTAWSALPGALRWQKFATLNRLGERYAAMIAEGVSDGSVRPLDPAVASQLVCGLINALAEAEHWVNAEGSVPLTQLMAWPLLRGLLAPPPSLIPDA